MLCVRRAILYYMIARHNRLYKSTLGNFKNRREIYDLINSAFV